MGQRAPGRRLSAAEIPVVILAGGMGTRLREVTERVPKPLVEIGERPILWHIEGSHPDFRHLRCAGQLERADHRCRDVLRLHQLLRPVVLALELVEVPFCAVSLCRPSAGPRKQ